MCLQIFTKSFYFLLSAMQSLVQVSATDIQQFAAKKRSTVGAGLSEASKKSWTDTRSAVVIETDTPSVVIPGPSIELVIALLAPTVLP